LKKKKADEDEKNEDAAPVVKKPRIERAKDAPDSTNDSTLFVRNIAWDVTQEGFKEHME